MRGLAVAGLIRHMLCAPEPQHLFLDALGYPQTDLKRRVCPVGFAFTSIFWTGVVRDTAARMLPLKLLGKPSYMRQHDLILGMKTLWR